MGQTEKNFPDDLVLIGLVTKPHGMAGEVKLKPLTDFSQRFQNLKKVFVVSKDGSLNEKAIENVKTGKNGAIIIKFSGINSISDASDIAGFEIAVNSEDCVKLPPDYYYIFDLVGLQVVLSHGDVIGTIEDVESNRAQDILLVKTIFGKNVMVPFVKEIVPEVLMSEKKVVVNNIPGLFDGD